MLPWGTTSETAALSQSGRARNALTAYAAETPTPTATRSHCTRPNPERARSATIATAAMPADSSTGTPKSERAAPA